VSAVGTPSAFEVRVPPEPTGQLRLEGIDAGYHRVNVLRDVTLTLPPHTVTALLGPNGAGKTTLMRVASGILRPTAGSVHLGDTDVTRWPAHRRARRGLCLIPEGRGIFPDLSVRDNLRMQTPPWSPDADVVAQALDVFPDLKQRLDQLGGSMSGGQQQMLALCRAWIARPEIVLLDEVSMGLAPRVIDQIFHALRELAASGVALLLVEQYVSRALDIADRVQIVAKGSVSAPRRPADIDPDALMAEYFDAV